MQGEEKGRDKDDLRGVLVQRGGEEGRRWERGQGMRGRAGAQALD